MPSEIRAPLQLSLLDRILDDGASKPGIASLRQSVRRDLESLLNSRRSWLLLPVNCKELEKSVLGYGLPDFTAMDLGDEDAREWLCREIERTIALFEPRLTRVTVLVKETDAPLDRLLRLRIDAVLLVEPVPQPVAFDSELEPVSLAVSLRECA